MQQNQRKWAALIRHSPSRGIHKPASASVLFRWFTTVLFFSGNILSAVQLRCWSANFAGTSMGALHQRANNIVIGLSSAVFSDVLRILAELSGWAGDAISVTIWIDLLDVYVFKNGLMVISAHHGVYCFSASAISFSERCSVQAMVVIATFIVNRSTCDLYMVMITKSLLRFLCLRCAWLRLLVCVTNVYGIVKSDVSLRCVWPVYRDTKALDSDSAFSVTLIMMLHAVCLYPLFKCTIIWLSVKRWLDFINESRFCWKTAITHRTWIDLPTLMAEIEEEISKPLDESKWR